MSALSQLKDAHRHWAACRVFLRSFAVKNKAGPVSEPEVANTAKGQELTREENLRTREITETDTYHAAVPGDLRSTSGNGLGDGLFSHTSKWLQVKLRIQAMPSLSLPAERYSEAAVGPLTDSFG